jgi:hypothetical protein
VMAEWRCEACGKTYKSKRSLRRHQKKVHGDEEGMPLDLVGDGGVPSVVDSGGEAREDPALGEGESAGASVGERLRTFEPKVLKRALADLGIDRDEVMSYRVYPDRVVVIQGPAGFKRVWRVPGK